MLSKKMVLHFSKDIWDKPIVYKLIKNYNLIINILKANVLPRQESYLVLDLIGEKEEDLDEGIRYLENCGVRVQSVHQDVWRRDDLCIHCGICTAVCPSGALYIERPEMLVSFDLEKCVACGMCVPACPVGAMETML